MFIFVVAGILMFIQYLSSCYADSMTFSSSIFVLGGGYVGRYHFYLNYPANEMFNNIVPPHKRLLVTVSFESPSFSPLS